MVLYMPSIHRIAAVSGLVCSLLLQACGSSPTVQFYSLSTRSSAGGSDSGLAVAIGPAQFPRGLARSQIVTRAGANRVDVNEYQVWSAPLESEFLRVLGDNVSRQLGSDHVSVYPREPAFPVDYTVLLDVLQFDGAPGDSVDLRVRWVLLSREGKSIDVGGFERSEPLNGNQSYDALVAAHSAALGALANSLAERLRALGKPPDS